MPDLRIGGFVPLSTVDRPGCLTATVFTQGCPWRCPYCHNPHLLAAAPSSDTCIAWADVMTFLDLRRGLLDGVVFSGGEPTAQAALVAAMDDARKSGFEVYLHTGGPFPRNLERVLPFTAWVGFDAKAPFLEYDRITGVAGSGATARESLRLLVASGVPFEVRTTVDPDLLDPSSLQRLANDLAAECVRTWVLQQCRTKGARPGSQTAMMAPASLGQLRERIENVTVR